MNRTYRKIALLVSFILLALAQLTTPSLADLPGRPGDESPAKPPSHKGAGIELVVTGAMEPYFAVVQWQDGLGSWRDVSGWRGEVEKDNVRWYVAPKDFGTGPFRWHVYDEAGQTLALSESFDLPSGHGHWVRIPVVVD